MMAAQRSPIRVVGRYALYNEIAAGGMATIHLGRLLGPVGFARTVAVKRLHPQYAKDPEFVSMFLDEARLAARVQHPNVVATIDVVATGGELFLIMDYVRGESLSKLLRMVRKQNQHVPPRIAAAIMCGFLHGLHSAHEAKDERGAPLGLVHRDVSPQNVLVGADGIPRVLDFGIAKAQGRVQVTRDGQIKGKLAYMPPEQLSGRELTRTVDIYASAVVMWETLTAERLFKGENEAETLARILREPVPAPTDLNPNLPIAFNAPLLRALSRDPKKRHQTAKELALEIEKCAGIASPTEVGEWVENLVGPIMSAREDVIQAIESSSAGMTVSQSIPPPDGSDSDISVPYARPALVSHHPSNDTIPHGSSLSHLQAAPMPTPRTSSRTGNFAPPPPPHIEEPSLTQPEQTGMTGLLTGTITLPMSKKLPILASLGGVAVLLIVVGVVVAGKTGCDGSKPPATTASVASATPSASAATTADREIPDPVVSASAAPVEELPANPPPPPPHIVQRPIAAPAPVPPPKPSVSTTTKKGCDPNYTIDPITGRKKYKLECM